MYANIYDMIVLQIPSNAKTYEMANSVIWLDEQGIMYSRPKETPYLRLTTDEFDLEIQKLREIIGHKKVKMILEAHPNSESPRKDERDHIAEQLASVTQAMALITNSAVSRMVANLFFLFKPAPYPMKMFFTAQEAKGWLDKVSSKGGMVSVF